MQWNTGRSYKLDRARHNKSEEYEVPVNKRKRRFKSGGTLVDDKKAMVLSQIKEVHHHADELAKVLANMDTVDAWVVGKMERATTDLSDITHYLDGTTEYAKGGMMAKGGYTEDDVILKDWMKQAKYFTVQVQTIQDGKLKETIYKYDDFDEANEAYEKAMYDLKVVGVKLKGKDYDEDVVVEEDDENFDYDGETLLLRQFNEFQRKMMSKGMMAKGGMMSDEMMSQKKVLFYRNKLVQMNVGKDSSALDFAIRIIDSMVDKDDEDYVFLTSLQNNKKALFYRNKLVQMNVGKNSSALDFAIKLIDMAYDGELKMAKGGEVKSKTKKYQILSPDGFTIEREVPYYTSKNKAMSAFDKWKENYSRQGYYSSVRYGRIDLLDLEDYCQFITL